jgi:penicillin-binding protein-related factor A (putative recombinase)
MLNKNQIKELEMITLLNKKFNSGDISFDETKHIMENSSDDRISYLLKVSDQLVRYEMIITILTFFDRKRIKKLLLPYNEFVRLINESNTQSKEVLTELYFLACEQIRTGYIPASPLTINLFR